MSEWKNKSWIFEFIVLTNQSLFIVRLTEHFGQVNKSFIGIIIFLLQQIPPPHDDAVYKKLIQFVLW